MFLQLHIQTVCECKETSPHLDLWDKNGDKLCVQLTPGTEETALWEGGLDSTHSLICMESKDVIKIINQQSKCNKMHFENSNECEI